MHYLSKTLIVATLASLLACGGAEERKEVYLQKAQESIKAGDLDKARIELKNVLQIDPKDAEAYFQLGKVMEAKQEFRKAFGNYNKANELDPNNPEYKAKIGRFYLVLANDVNKAEEQLKEIEAVDQNNRHGLLLKAGILFKKGQNEQALAILEKLNADDPADTETTKFLVQIYLKDKSYEKAQNVLKKAIDAHQDDTSLKTMLAQAYILAKQPKKAEATLREVMDIKPEVFSHYVNLAKFYQSQGQGDKAEQVLLEAIELDENDVKRKLTYLDLIQQAKDKETAIDEIDRLYAEKPQPELLLAKAALQYALKDNSGAIRTYEQVAKQYSEEEPGIKARVAMATLYAQDSDIDNARRVIDEATTIAPNDASVNRVVAKIAIFDKDYDKAIASLRTVVKDDPSNIEAYLLLAQAHKANGDDAQHDAAIQNAYENNRGNSKALEVLAAYHAKQGDLDEALKINESITALKVDDYNALAQKASLLNKKQDYSEAFKIAEKLRALAPAKVNGYAEAIPYLLSQKRFPEAVALLQEGYDKSKDIRLLSATNDLDLKTGNYEDVIKRIEKLDDYSDREQLIIQLAQAYFANGEKEKAQKLLEDSIQKDPARTTSRLALVAIKRAIGADVDTIKLLEEGLVHDAKSTRLRTTLASLYEAAGNIERAKELYNEILAISPNNVIATNNLAALLVDSDTSKESLARALELADKLKKAKQPVLQDTVGWVYYKNGKYDEAVEILKQVVDAAPDTAVYNYHLGMALLKKGDKDAAKQYLEKAVNSEKAFDGKDEAKAALTAL